MGYCNITLKNQSFSAVCLGKGLNYLNIGKYLLEYNILIFNILFYSQVCHNMK